MSQNRKAVNFEGQLNLFSSNEKNSNSISETGQKEANHLKNGESNIDATAKVVSIKSISRSEIYEKILKRTMS